MTISQVSTDSEPSTKPLQPRPPRRRTSAFQHLMSVHWWMANLYAILFIGGWFMVNAGGEFSFRGEMYDFHKSIGVVTMMLLSWRVVVLLRVWWRKYTKRLPRLSKSWWQKTLLHGLLYLFMWAVPVTGFFLSNSYRANNVHLFGILLPDLFPQNDAMVDLARSFHFWFAYIFLALTVLHSIDQWKVVRSGWRRLVNWGQGLSGRLRP